MTMRIIFNGKEYGSPEDMPSDVRKAYDEAMAQLADADRDGIPDIVQRGAAVESVIGIHHSSITVNGRTYSNVDEMPWYVRRLYEKALEQVDANRDGIPDVLQPEISDSEAPGRHGTAEADVVGTTFHKELRWGRDANRPPGLASEAGTRPGLLLLALVLIGLVVVLFWWL